MRSNNELVESEVEMEESVSVSVLILLPRKIQIRVDELILSC